LTDPEEELAALRARLAAGLSANHAEAQHRIAKPIYILAVEDNDLSPASVTSSDLVPLTTGLNSALSIRQTPDLPKTARGSDWP